MWRKWFLCIDVCAVARVPHASGSRSVGHAERRDFVRLGARHDHRSDDPCPRIGIEALLEPLDGVGRNNEIAVDQQYSIGAPRKGGANAYVNAAGESQI